MTKISKISITITLLLIPLIYQNCGQKSDLSSDPNSQFYASQSDDIITILPRVIDEEAELVDPGNPDLMENPPVVSTEPPTDQFGELTFIMAAGKNGSLPLSFPLTLESRKLKISFAGISQELTPVGTRIEVSISKYAGSFAVKSACRFQMNHTQSSMTVGDATNCLLNDGNYFLNVRMLQCSIEVPGCAFVGQISDE